MRWRIRYDEEALDDLAQLRAFDRVRILDEIEQNLTDRPNVEEGKKRLITLQDGSAIWRLRSGDFRAYYDVDESAHAVTIRRVRFEGRKSTEEVLKS